MRGEVVMKRRLGKDGEYTLEKLYFLDGFQVDEKVYRALMPSAGEKVSQKRRAAALATLDAIKAEAAGGPPLTSTRGKRIWPKYSSSLGVLPHQVKKRMDYDRARGVPTEYRATKDGFAAEPVYTSREHRKKHCRAHGVIDRQGGYGDAT